jgi:hypothetical protein
MEEEFFA